MLKKTLFKSKNQQKKLNMHLLNFLKSIKILL
jgi:hypothetical protein